MAVVFRQVDGTQFYDLMVDGRIAEYDVERDDFQAALRRRRLDRSDSPVFVEDESGHRTRLTRR